jgi:hypothetical protein
MRNNVGIEANGHWSLRDWTRWPSATDQLVTLIPISPVEELFR